MVHVQDFTSLCMRPQKRLSSQCNGRHCLLNHSVLFTGTVVQQVGANTEIITTPVWFGTSVLVDTHSLLSPIHANPLCT